MLSRNIYNLFKLIAAFWGMFMATIIWVFYITCNITGVPPTSNNCCNNMFGCLRNVGYWLSIGLFLRQQAERSEAKKKYDL